MEAWAKDTGVAGSMITFLADTRGELTKALDLELTDAGPVSVLGNTRGKRAAVVVEDGVVKHVAISYSKEDPAGGADPSATMVDAILKAI
mmetsp:Transcript_5212/g.15479  ORF Transcript_5212/g.15479 Transcript_5212/m.15479 type:complete len:90 (+) Transcript_5212:369-638(+)